MGCRPALLGLSAILGNTPLNELASLIEPTLREMGFELVQVLVMGKERRTLQVMAEPTDQTRQMTIEDCAEISRAVSAILDVADPLPGEYRLEVSSPGIDRPLVRPQDYVRFAGFEARLETVMLQDGQRRFTGILRGLDGDEVLLEGPDGVRRIGLDGIRKAKLTLSDALLKAGLKAGAAGREQG